MRRVLSLSWPWVVLGCWLWAAGPVQAAPYEVEPESGGELELLALLEEGAISGETLAALLALRRAGVDPGLATRASLYGLPGLTYAQVDALLRQRAGRGGGRGRTADSEVPPLGFGEDPARDRRDAARAGDGGLTDEEARRLAAFLVRREEGRLSGDARLMMAFAASDGLLPPMALQVRAGGLGGLQAGVLVSLARRRPGAPRRDARRRALVVEAPGPSVLLPKFHVRWSGARASALLGTYRLGFGQRLTLDTTALPAPDGFLPDDGVRPPGALERECLVGGTGCEPEERLSEVTPDFGWDEGFRGLVGTVRGPLGPGAELSLTGFGSYQLRSVQRHAVLDRSLCTGARGGCRAPDVWVPLEDSRVEKLTARTLPGAFQEWAGGGNATLSLSSRAQVGVTGWVARPVWAVDGARLDFQPSARYPAGGGFGAVGLDAAWGHGAVDLFFEGARSFDSAPEGGGGFGALQRTVLSGERRELELALRYYGRDFANPYGGAPSGPDALEGLRARNELGARLRYLQREEGAWRVRGQVDAWTPPTDGAVPGSAGTLNVRASARADWLVWPLFQPSLQVELRDSEAGSDAACLQEEEADGCSRGRYGLIVRVRSEVADGVTLAAQYGHARVEEPRQAGPRYDGQAVLDVRLRPSESVRLGGRVAWRDEDLSERTRLRQELRTVVDASWAVFDTVTARARYAWVLDLKDALGARVPPDPPRHLFQLELETRL
ncbi:hypothetical protein [Pyxidicoccus xibeiensis]|uniref:hypothetical protein n=1 Tax=Pyxidicoccus xibeiensis TaxID=2906759 RepID=UPI0020A80325|nr:hypothetical protein [Pyxidicoccus xibeiensis]MCP3136300.1 hypothetical protein [Pyxidicoccus xibeiensis]